jgi:hypothetical protein
MLKNRAVTAADATCMLDERAVYRCPRYRSVSQLLAQRTVGAAREPRRDAIERPRLPAGRALRRAMRCWRTGLLAVVLLCFLLLVSAEAWHHHRDSARDSHCGLCQVAAHQPLDFEPPTYCLPVTFLRLVHVLSVWQPRIRFVSSPLAGYRSRAPPQAL